MEETKEAVNTAESAPVEQSPVVNTPDTSTEQATTTPAADTAPAVPAANLDVDEYGVPWKNRAMEWKRKSEETIDKLPTLIDEAVKNSVQQYAKPAEKEYTISELEQFAMQSPEHRPWVEEQKALLIKKQLTREVEAKFKAQDSQKQAEIKRQNSFNWVANTFPETILRNEQGQPMGVNTESPMVQEINRIMQDPRFANDPEGLVGAAQIAYARVALANQGKLKQNEAKLKAEVKHLQKQTLVEGGSKANVQAIPAHRIALDKAKQTGNLKDVAAAMKAMAEHRKALMEK